VIDENRRLHKAAVIGFGSWGKALRAAGINMEETSGKRRWTANRVLCEIRNLDRQGIPLNNRSVKNIDQGLAQAARKLWGSWDDALRAAGYEPEKIRLIRKPWTKPAVLEAIRGHIVSGGRILKNALRPRSLAHASWRLFGSFDEAVKAAGFGELLVPKSGWSSAAVTSAILARQKAGKPLNTAAVIRDDSPLYDAARNHHGGWSNALKSAGIDPDAVRAIRKPWTPESVIAELQRMARDDRPPVPLSSIRPVPLVTACRRFFGSFAQAASAAKVDRARIAYIRRPTSGSVRRKSGES
jgi:hypothetical protein